MQHPPAEFRLAISHHNRQTVLAVFLSLLGALLAWAVVYALFVGVVLGGTTIIRGEDMTTGTFASAPKWLHPAAIAICGAIMVLGFINHRINRFRPIDDRQVIGWHLAFEVLFIPARLTIAIFSNFASLIVLNGTETYEAWRLLWIIIHEKRLSVSEVGRYTSMPKAAPKLLGALQLLGWIDLHHNQKEDDWYYMVRSDNEEEARALVGIPKESEKELAEE
jgi:hypothetical protein